MLWFQWLAWLFPVMTSHRKAPITFRYFWFQNKSNVFPRRLSLLLSVMLTGGRKCISRLHFLEVNADDIFCIQNQLKWHNDHCVQWCAKGYEPPLVSLYFFLICFQGGRFSWNVLKWSCKIVLRVFFLWISWTAFHPFSVQKVLVPDHFKRNVVVCCLFFVFLVSWST